MFGFGKKAVAKPTCNHKWKDFPWYVSVEYVEKKHVFDLDEMGYRISIYEPYVCIFCKERKDVLLWSSNIMYNKAQAFDLANKLHDEYAPRTQDRVITEDQITDMQLVDRDYLEMYNKIIKGE